MSKEDYNAGLDTAASIVEEMLGGTSEGETILCGIESSKMNISEEFQDQINYENDYCAKCDSCGDTGCCPPIMCEAVKCKYGEIYLKDYECFQDQWGVMFNALKDISEVSEERYTAEIANNALKAVDELWDKLYSKSQTTDHEPAVAVHDVFNTAIPNAFGVDFLRRLIGKSNSKE
jgi:hypothetical protein